MYVVSRSNLGILRHGKGLSKRNKGEKDSKNSIQVRREVKSGVNIRREGQRRAPTTVEEKLVGWVLPHSLRRAKARTQVGAPVHGKHHKIVDDNGLGGSSRGARPRRGYGIDGREGVLENLMRVARVGLGDNRPK